VFLILFLYHLLSLLYVVLISFSAFPVFFFPQVELQIVVFFISLIIHHYKFTFSIDPTTELFSKPFLIFRIYLSLFFLLEFRYFISEHVKLFISSITQVSDQNERLGNVLFYVFLVFTFVDIPFVPIILLSKRI